MTTAFTTYPAALYHADPHEGGPSLSSSIGNLIVSRSPRHGWLAHPKLGGVRKVQTKTFDRGSLIHKLVLGEGAEIVAVDAADWRTKLAQQQRDDAYTAGKIPCLIADLEDAQEATVEINRQLAAYGIELTGRSEVCALWAETATDGTEVQCRAMLDHWLPVDRMGTIYDLKSCRSAHPAAIQRHIPGYGYDLQAAAYVRGVERIEPERAGRVDFVFLFTELDPAVTVTPVRRSGTLRELGERKWNRAIDLWARCLTANDWPGYVNDIIEIEAPPWALTDFDNADFAAELAAS